MEKNKRNRTILLIWTELGIMALGGGGVLLIGLIRRTDPDRLLSELVMTVAGLAVIGFQMRQEYVKGKLDYNNGKYPFRFWLCVCIGLAVAFACVFLPASGWPFLTVFVMLALFSNMSTGILASCVLLMISVILSGVPMNYYALYLISGCFAASLFQHLEIDFTIGMPLTLSILCLLICETANVVLLANARPDAEMFLVPAANIIINAILLVGGLRLFSSMVIYQYRVNYLEINDTSNPALVRFKEESRDDYFISIHAAHFCDLICKKIGMDENMLKCAAYYHRMGDELPKLMVRKHFPPKLREILMEYKKNEPPKNKETAILACSDMVVSSITQMLRENGDEPIDYKAFIDDMFRKLVNSGYFWQCDISMREYKIMHQIFREEKMYYDFLR
ncbi:MAG: hypothetical protein NC420_02795 [Eubacterium sp.]|nr:hypothetical protein [Eubacterium sp.]MCM1216597.1 hypothetical protein [Lachnospiraceae bacterium]MCM1303003.1 hypothetical protein [Butyrivibrio sp.]MCM1343788.1 hypothetical protein [Muribaculaceae bacterium]MCM1239734.1 hypothetical protein [Lachnospiraceae bacterium]